MKNEFRMPCRNYQLECYDMSKDMFYFGFLVDMGLGKSKLFTDTMCYLRKRDKIDGALIVAPKGCYHNWAANTEDKPEKWDEELWPELTKHMWKSVQAESYVHVWNTGKPAKRNEMMKKIILPEVKTGKFHILVMNTEAFSTDRGTAFASIFLRNHPRAIIGVDEASMMRHTTSARTKNLISLGKLAAYRRILTGTLVANSPLDVFGPMKFLSSSIFGDNFFTFRARYAILKEQFLKNRSFKVVVGFQRMEEMKSRMAPFIYRKTQEDVEDLPPKIYMRREVPLTPEQKKAYLAMKNQAVHELTAENSVTATVVIAKIMKMRQILCGHVIDDQGVCHPIAENRTAEVIACLREISGKAVIWSPFLYNVEKMCAELEKEFGPGCYVKYIGATKHRKEAVDSFLTDPKINFFVATEQTGKFGLSLPGVKYVFFIANDPDLEIRLQAEGRNSGINRGVKGESTVYTDFVSPGTLDVKQVNALRKKKGLADIVNGDTWRAFLTEEVYDCAEED